MKTSVFFLAGMLIAVIATGQNQELEKFKVTQPAFMGEYPNSINAHIQKKAEFPATELKWGVQGTVVAGFVITPTGELKNIEIINSVSDAIDNEVIQVLKRTNGMWRPGVVNGEAVAMPNEVSVVFKLYQEDNFIEIAENYLQKGLNAFFVKDKPEKALKYFNQGINFLPNDEAMLAVRGLCKFKLGDETGANRDWKRSKYLAKRNGTSTEIDNLAKIPDNSEEYDEMLRALIK